MRLALLPLALFALAPAAAGAQTLADGYAATPAAASSLTRFTTRGTPWFRRGDAFVAPHAPERAPQVCAMAARKLGRLAQFTAAGEPLSADALAACNATAAE